MFSLGRDPYSNLDLSPEMTVPEETLLLALKGAKKTISGMSGIARALPADKEACVAYREVDDLVRRTSESVDKRKLDLGPARYVRWGNFCLSWLALRDDLPTIPAATIISRVTTARQYTVLCAEEISRLPAAATTMAPAKAQDLKKDLKKTGDIGWRPVVLAAGVGAAVVLLVKRVFQKWERS